MRGQQVFEKLVVDGVAPLDSFIEGLESVYESEMDTMYNLMDQVANLRRLPPSKFHSFSVGKDGYREWEFKTKHLRIYTFAKKGGQIVVLGGTKSKQRDSVTKFHRLKKAYLKSLDYED